MRKYNWLIAIVALAIITSCGQSKKKEDASEGETEEVVEVIEVVGPNMLTAEEEADGWILMFDGKTSDGWRGYKKETFPAAWNIDNESIHIQGSGRGEAGAADGGDIIYDQIFSDFHFKVEWMVDSAANAGIFYRGREEFDYIWKSAPEMQVLDNHYHPDAKLGKDGNRQAGSLYDMIPADPQNFKGHGTWNTAEVLAIGNEITHIQNGDTVVRYTIGSDEMAALIAVSKWPELNPDWGNIRPEGIIGLQDHGDNVWFRNIKIKEL